MPYTYKYPRPALTVDAVVFKKEKDNLLVLLIKRKNPPYKGMWALPGGFVDMDETLEQAAARELKEETGIALNNLTQLKAYSEINRDPRFRNISVAFTAFLNDNQNALAGDDADEAHWFNVEKLPPLAFDHNVIIKDALMSFLNK